MPETRHYCPHCDEKVSLSTLHRHKQLYYDQEGDIWTRSTDCASSDGSCCEEEDLCLERNFDDDPLEGNVMNTR